MTASQPDVSLPIEAHGQVRLESPTGRCVEFVARGDALVLDVPGWPELRAMMPRSFWVRSRVIRAVASACGTYGLVFSLEFEGKPVFQLGRDIRPSFLARLLGLAPARLTLTAFRLFLRR